MHYPKIYGFNKTSEAGVKVFAPSIFLQGCNFKCPFCFNSSLAKSKMKDHHEIPLKIIDDFILEHHPDMIMISGGEAMVNNGLQNLMHHFRSMGLKIGLSTNGVLWDRFIKIMHLVNYVAMDIKSADPETYEIFAPKGALNKVRITHGILRDNKRTKGESLFDYEVRTTLYPPYVNFNTIHQIGQMMEDNERWVLQQYRPTVRLYDMEATKGIEPYDFETLQRMLTIARTYTKGAQLRYV